MEALLKHLVSGLVQHPEQVRISSAPGGRGGTLWELRVAAEDFPRVIGRGGRTARSLRAVLESADRGPVCPMLNIVDPEDDGQPV
ncbi:MAG TPA: KH domain-containing protein [Terriglobales bacterium]|nr:KH domain-containing protein [Terriglobales bacterium]